jgi:glycerol-3-phosphate acyltransferase PlsY
MVSSYFIGSSSTAHVAGSLGKEIDIRQMGSRNRGAMNVIYNVDVAKRRKVGGVNPTWH